MFARWSQYPPFSLPEQVFCSGQRGDEEEWGRLLSLFTRLECVYVGEWAEEIRVTSLFTTPVMRCCLWATKTHWWPRYRKRICVERGLLNALIGVLLQKLNPDRQQILLAAHSADITDLNLNEKVIKMPLHLGPFVRWRSGLVLTWICLFSSGFTFTGEFHSFRNASFSFDWYNHV